MRTKIVAGNWKMNTVVSEGKELVDGILSKLSTVPSDVQLIVAPPFTHLSEVASKLAGSSVALAAQNCADHEKGAYTGEVSVAMLKSVGCSYVILGHSERREYYGETSETLVTKVKLALAAGLKPIFCVGEVKDERVAGKHFEVVGKQIEEVLFTLTAEEMAQVVIAYEPVWAIGTGLTATSEQAQEIHAFIRKALADKFGAALAEEITILYGGSCKPSNAPELFAQPDIDGGLIGGAALKAEDFIGIATSY
ncbi:MAG: triose-phosphate isomerase [Bacteroidales bacterium]|jgi:triosephosphate isomerase|nr:triose-phosphate isomerase [Bacteroidales bacterium]